MLLFASGNAPAQQVPNAVVGFRPEGVYDFGQFDDISIYSGALSISLPLGPAYPRNAGRALQLQLSYLASAWSFRVDDDLMDDCVYPPGAQCKATESQPKAYPRAGLGWMVSLGELLAPNNKNAWNPVNGFVYISSDGAEHTFFNTLREGDAEDPGDNGATQLTRYTRDGSYLRFRQITADLDYRIDFPNGDQHLFHNSGTVLVPDYRLQSITDPFGNVVNLSYGFDTVEYLAINDGFRTNRIEYAATGLLHQPWVISRVRTACFQCGSGVYADYTFNYATESVYPPPGNSYQHWGGPRTVQLLSSIVRPDGLTIGFEYSARLFGLLERANLPTGGAIEWVWVPIDFPAFRKNRTVDLKPGDEDVYQVNYGVAERRYLDGSGEPLGLWTYDRAHDGPPLNPAAEKFTVTVTSPLKDKSVYYFSVYPVIYTDGNPGPRWETKVYEFGLPYTRDFATEDSIVGDSVQRYLSAEYFDCDANGENCVKKRSTFVAYETDDENAGNDTNGSLFNKNRRLLSERIVYHDDGGKWTLRTHQDDDPAGTIDFDGFGNYRRLRTLANFDAGNEREVYTGNNWHQEPPIAPGARWILTTFDHIDVTEGGETARQTYGFDTSLGFLNCVRSLASGTTPGAHDVLVRYTGSSGNVTKERYFGGDLQVIDTTGACGDSGTLTAEYTIDHTYQYGSRKTSKYNGVAWKSLDLDLDAKTGQPTRSRNAAGVATDYTFDPMSRIKKVIPQGAAGITADAWTLYTYPTVGDPDTLTVDRCAPGAGGCTGSNRIIRSYVDYDALGRVSLDGQELPNGSFNIRKSTYDAAGNKYQVSTIKASGSGTFFYTTYSGHDAFNRPTTITAPDNKVTSLAYAGIREITTTQSIALSLGGGDADVSRKETMDGQGRLFRVEEYSNPAAPGTYVTTEYGYDEVGRLTRVCQNGSLTTCSGQERLFNYDNRGFLLSEKHPEVGAVGEGDVHYFSHDSRGHVGNRNNELSYEYDSAERLTTVLSASTETMLKSFTWDGASGAGAGKVHTATRRNWVNGGGTFQVAETYSYSGRMGRPSNRTTSITKNGVPGELWTMGTTYDSLGGVASVTYPVCSGTGCTPDSTSPRTVSYARTKGYLTEIPGWTASGQTITYHPNLQVATIPHVNGMTVTLANDPKHLARPNSITASSPIGSWASGTYAYDGAGNIKAIGSDLFQHDKVSRTVAATLGSLAPSRTQSYSFDRYGNITFVTTDGTGLSLPTSEDTNRLTGSVFYTSRGNLQSWNGQVNYFDEFDMIGRRCATAGTGEVPSCSGEVWNYAYTADDERVFEVGGPSGGEVWTLRGFDNQVLRRDLASGTWDFVYADGKLFGAVIPTPTGTAYRHYALDHLGSVRFITNGASPATCTNSWRHTYFPFGEEATTPSDGEIMKFAGHQRDLLSTASNAADDLDYMHARFRSPLTGRFLSVDPAGGDPTRPQSWNRYAYVLGNPLKFTDPDGKKELEAWKIVWTRLKHIIDKHIRKVDTPGTKFIANNPRAVQKDIAKTINRPDRVDLQSLSGNLVFQKAFNSDKGVNGERVIRVYAKQLSEDTLRPETAHAAFGFKDILGLLPGSIGTIFGIQQATEEGARIAGDAIERAALESAANQRQTEREEIIESIDE